MLRIVHPPPEGQEGTRPPSGKRVRSPVLSLTAEEARHFRAALRNCARAFGSWRCLAEVIGVQLSTLEKAMSPRHRPSGALALRLAQAAGMHMETILSGQLTAAGRCPACGSRVGDRPVRSAGGVP